MQRVDSVGWVKMIETMQIEWLRCSTATKHKGPNNTHKHKQGVYIFPRTTHPIHLEKREEKQTDLIHNYTQHIPNHVGSLIFNFQFLFHFLHKGKEKRRAKRRRSGFWSVYATKEPRSNTMSLTNYHRLHLNIKHIKT